MEPNNQNVLVDPRMLEVGYRREKANPFAMKSYFPVVGQVTRLRSGWQTGCGKCRSGWAG